MKLPNVVLLTVAIVATTGPAHPDAPKTTPPTLEFAFSEVATLGTDVKVGGTAYGVRNIVPITGGAFEGPGIKGTILPGGWDWQLTRADGCSDIEADYMLRTDDGVVINVRNRGVACPPPPGAPFSARTQPVFEAPLGKYDWLSKSAFISTLEPATAPDGGRAVRVTFYRVR